MKRTLALTRGVPSSFARATVQRAGDADDPAIDVQRARAQHAAYVEALRALGLEVVSLPADDAFPDCCFIEDCALVAGGVALVTSLGAPPVAAKSSPCVTRSPRISRSRR